MVRIAQPARRRDFFARVFVMALTTGFAGGAIAMQAPQHASPAVAAVGAATETLDSRRGAGLYPLFASVDLHAGSATARQALIIIHGRLRNASDYYATALALVQAAGTAGEDTMVVAPQFLNQEDVVAFNLSDRYLRWSDDWGEGAPAQTSPSSSADKPAASAYDVLDDVLEKLSNTSAFPALKRIVFVGHGGGAQLLARYAVVMHQQVMPPETMPAVSFVIANAGTYLYPIAARPVPLDCPESNLWKYGLDKPPPYVGDTGTILKNFAARDVTLLLGAKDRKANGILDQSCAAQAQGPNRVERGRYFAKEMNASGIAPRLKHVIVPGAGHNEKGMLLSDEALGVIFPSGGAGH
jgi:hypothetical protein